MTTTRIPPTAQNDDMGFAQLSGAGQTTVASVATMKVKASTGEAPFILHAWLRSGNTASGRGVIAFLTEALTQLPAGWRIRTVRADSGFLDQALLAFLEERGLPYLIVVRETEREDKDAVGRLLYVPGHTFRLRVTNRSEPPEELWRDSNQRATIGQRIEELKNDMHAGGFCAKAVYIREAEFLGTLLACNLLAVYQGQVTAKEGWRKPSTLRAAVFACAAVLGRAGRKLVPRFSQNGGGLAKHRALIDKAKETKNTIAPLLPRPRRPEVEWTPCHPAAGGFNPAQHRQTSAKSGFRG